MAFDARAHEILKENMVHVFTDFPESLRVTHELSVASLVFIACHELAHHASGDLAKDEGPALEFAADTLGLELATRVYQSTTPMRLLRPNRQALAGVWTLMSLWDLIERVNAVRNKQMMRLRSKSHPFAADRLARLTPTLLGDPETYHLIKGFGPAVEGFRRDLALAEIG